MDGLNVYVAGSADVNFLFDSIFLPRRNCEALQRQITYIRGSFYQGYFGKKKIKDVKYSDAYFSIRI